MLVVRHEFVDMKIREDFFKFRQTVVCVTCCRHNNGTITVALVEPSKAPRGTFILPQGGINRGEPLERAALRELTEELRIRNFIDSLYLGSAYHILPPDRGGAIKALHFMRIDVDEMPTVPGNDENRSVAWAYSPTDLSAITSGARWSKRRAVSCAVFLAQVWPSTRLWQGIFHKPVSVTTPANIICAPM